MRYRFEVTVICPDPDSPLRLTGVVAVTNWSFVLLAQGTTPLRKLTRHGPGHKNPSCQRCRT